MSFSYLKQILAAGGPVLYLLIGLSVYTVALIWERWTTFKLFKSSLADASDKVRQGLRAGSLDKALESFKDKKDPVAWVFARVMVLKGNRDERRAAAERVIDRQIGRLEAGLTVLGTIGSTAPFIGLFGTVLGVMRAFRDLATFAGAGPGVVAVGISEALVTTAAGLFVAIPAIVAYNLFHRRTESFTEELAWMAEEVMERSS